MAFWSSEKLRNELKRQFIVTPYDESTRVKHGAYELSLGNEYFTTVEKAKKKVLIADGDQINIDPGQFALLITSEVISVPNDAMGFISIKAGIKFRGLVNVSGFHVDPGFKGRLKFAVYNAGSKSINLTQGKPVFLIWFADLSQPTVDLYNGNHANGEGISSSDVMRIAGDIASPAELSVRVEKIERVIGIVKYIIGAIILSIFTGFAGRYLFKEYEGWAQEKTLVNEKVVTGSQNSSSVNATGNHTDLSKLKKNAKQNVKQPASGWQ